MSEHLNPSSKPLRPSRTGLIAMGLFLVAQVARTLTDDGVQDRLPWYLGLMLAYLILFIAVLWRPGLPSGLLHLYFVIQSAITLALLSLNPQIDSVTTFFVPLSYQAALVFGGQTLWLWICCLVLLTGGSLMFYLEALRGLALGLITMAGCVVLPAYVVANHEIEMAHTRSQMLLGELEATHRQLQTYANQVEELAAMEERNRLARELHDSVSQTLFSITLNTRAAQILLKREPARVRLQLGQLQELTQNALAQMRTLIAELRL